MFYRVSWRVATDLTRTNLVLRAVRATVWVPRSGVCLVLSLSKLAKRKGHGTTIVTSISKKIVSFLGFAFFERADLVTAASNSYKLGTEMIEKMQAPMTKWCGCICTTGGLIAHTKTRWYLVSFLEL